MDKLLYCKSDLVIKKIKRKLSFMEWIITFGSKKRGKTGQNGWPNSGAQGLDISKCLDTVWNMISAIGDPPQANSTRVGPR